MRVKRISNVLGILLMSLSLIFITSCDKDDDGSKDPSDAVTLNMLNEQNGKTQLGVSGVYINKSNNFYTSSNLISEVGRANGVGVAVDPKLTNLVREVAVTPGHVYQIFEYETVREFPSGTPAVPVDAFYYQVYVVSPIKTDEVITGAVVKYVSILPDRKDLPEFEYKLGDIAFDGDNVEMRLPKGAEWYMNSYSSELFNLVNENGKLQISLKEWPDNEQLGNHSIYIRLGSVFTVVTVNVVEYIRED